MNEMIKAMTLALLDEAVDISEHIDIDEGREKTAEQIKELKHLLNKIKTGVSKIQ